MTTTSTILPFSEFVDMMNSIEEIRKDEVCGTIFRRFSRPNDEGVTIVTISKVRLSGYNITVGEWEEFIAYWPLESFLLSASVK